MNRAVWLGVLAASVAAVATTSLAQIAPGATPRPPAYPQRQVDKAAVDRGKALYVNNGCSFCHGADIRGGDGGPSLQRSAIVLNDEHGEKIGVIIKNGVKGTAMPAFRLTDEQIGDIADFLHSFRVINGGETAKRPVSIIVGKADAGRAYFQKTCAACHSATGDLAHIATKYTDEVALQQAWIAPKATKPVSATVTMPNGEKVTGRPTRLDEFSITLEQPGGPRTIARNGAQPKVEITDPLGRHAALTYQYKDADIHDVTAYLVTLK